MKYIITRTSTWDKKPIKNCTMHRLERYRDIRTFDSLEQWKERFPKDFDRDIYEQGITEDGEPYMVVEGGHVKFYVVEIEDLHEFVLEHGQIVVSPPNSRYIGWEGVFQLEIYDNWRE